jgi:signal transduction histidine kinase
LFHPYLFIWILYATLSAWALLRDFTTHKVLHPLTAKIILAGTVIGYLGGCSNYFLWYGIEVLPLGHISASIYTALVAYAIMKNKLFNVKVIATELLIFALWLFLFVRMLLADTFAAQMLEASLLAVSLGIGVLLIRSVGREVAQREEIERLSAEKSEFMTFASHEIRNPITAMRGLASLIVDGTTGAVPIETKDAAQKILVAGHDVLNIISTYLSKSKMELGQIKYDSAPFDLGEAVSSIAEGYEPHAEIKGLTLVRQIDRSHKYMMVGDQSKVREVVGNLIDNSLKYTREGGITVSVERHGPFVRAVISDTGVGIPKEVIPHLFQKFTRADAQKVNLLGTGIGLYLAKTFIEAQGGRVWAESEGEGKGARFIVEFPAA